ncbi:replicative DNA helicase [Pasteurella multocida]
MEQIHSKLPHYSMEAEQAVLGSLLLANDKWDDIQPIINSSNFYFSAHKVIFSAIQSLLENNQPADLLTVERELSQQRQDINLLEEIGGIAYLAELAKNTPSIANAVTYAEAVRTDSHARQLFALGNTLRADAEQIRTKENLESVLEQTEKALTELSLNHLEQETVVPIHLAMNTVLQRMDASCNNQTLITGVPFGITQLDNNTTGAQSGDLIILAGRPSMGKTALSLVFAKSALESIESKPIQYYSLEMPASQIMARFLSMDSRVNATKIRQSMLMDDEDWARFSQSMEYFKEKWTDRLLIDDSSYLTPQLLRSRVRRNIRKYGKPSMVIVDYLQLMTVPELKNGQNRHLEISEISRSLKNLAKEIECPVIALSQLNRNLEQRADKRPMSSDLRESGSLEQDADVLLFIYRDEVYHEDTELPGIAEIIIGKQRNGPIGTVFSRFKGEFSLFETIPETEYEQIKGR